MSFSLIQHTKQHHSNLPATSKINLLSYAMNDFDALVDSGDVTLTVLWWNLTILLSSSHQLIALLINCSA